jgi:hypothetical protein
MKLFQCEMGWKPSLMTIKRLDWVGLPSPAHGQRVAP